MRLIENNKKGRKYRTNLILILLLILVFPFISFSQKNLAKGDKLYNLNLFNEAIPYYLEEIKTGSTKAKDEAMIKLANCYRVTGQFEEAEEMYKKIFKRKKKDPVNLLHYAQSLKSSAKYEEAAEQFKEYQKLNPSDPMGDSYIQSCYLAQKWLDEAEEDEVRNLALINTPSPEFAPVPYEKGIVFSSSRENSKKRLINFNGGIDEAKLDLYYQDLIRKGEIYSELKNLEGINSYLHEGPATFSADGKEIYFTRTIKGSRNKKGNTVTNTLQIFYSELDSMGKWSTPISAFAFNSEKYSVAHPSLSADGKRIYFMSDMLGGHGGTDIYYVEKGADGQWGEPINVEAPVNTVGNELFPFINSDGILYFSSNFHPGMGKLDIFSSKYDGNKWGDITNLKPPINSIGDDFAISFIKKSQQGFFSSDRFNGKGADDVYSFIKIAPLRITINGGNIQLPDQSLFDGIKFKLIDEVTKEERVLEPEAGMISFSLEENKDYILSARKDGFSYNKVALRMIRNTDKEYLEVLVEPLTKPILVNGYLLEEEILARKDSSDTLAVAKREVPVEGATVFLRDSLTEINTFVTDSQGEFNFTVELEASTPYTIIALKDTLKPKKEWVEYRGIVTEKGSEIPLRDVIIKLFKSIELQEELKVSDIGEYFFKIEKGDTTYSITALSEGYTPKSESLIAKENESSDVVYRNIELEKTVEIQPEMKGEEEPKEEIKEEVAQNEKVQPEEPVEKQIEKQDEIKQPIEEEVKTIQLYGTVLGNLVSLPNSQVTLAKRNKIINKTKSDSLGNFILTLFPEEEYTVTVTREGYFQKEVEVSSIGKNSVEGMKIEIKLDTIVIDKPIEIKNIYYDYDKAEIRYESLPELDKLVTFLRANPNVMIELRAHTDSRGDDDYNLKLSQARAEMVAKYLTLEEIDKKRVIAKGYGETEPVTPHAKTEKEHQLNRRTEFKVIKNKS